MLQLLYLLGSESKVLTCHGARSQPCAAPSGQARWEASAAAGVAEAPTAAPPSTYPTPAARRAAFTEDILPEQVWPVRTLRHACGALEGPTEGRSHQPDARPTRCRQDHVAVPVKGALPGWLRGAFIRNGPGTFRGMKHLFDGYAMLVSFDIEDGQVHVTQRRAGPSHSAPSRVPACLCHGAATHARGGTGS